MSGEEGSELQSKETLQEKQPVEQEKCLVGGALVVITSPMVFAGPAPINGQSGNIYNGEEKAVPTPAQKEEKPAQVQKCEVGGALVAHSSPMVFAGKAAIDGAEGFIYDKDWMASMSKPVEGQPQER